MNVRIIFEAAIEIADPKSRRAFVEKACAGNPELLAELIGLLASHDGLNSFLEKSPAKPQKSERTASFDSVEGETELDADPRETESNAILAFLTPSTKPDMLGSLGHYEVLSSLGQGGFGTVLKAFDVKLHRSVAIKILNPTLAATSPPRKRFIREARSGAAVSHENVVQVYAVEEQPLPYLVMEFVDGCTLQDKMDQEGPFELPEIINIGRQIASGLAAAHALGLIHREIKPGNILLEKGVERKVKITDFGLARAAADASLTQSGVIIGTPMYMAPEQAKGGKLDHRADLFSFGSVLYAMACGHPPFRAAHTLAVLRRVAEDTPRPLQEMIPELPNWLVAVISKLMAKDPDQRFQSAKEVAELFSSRQRRLRAKPSQPTEPAVANLLSGIKLLDEPRTIVAPNPAPTVNEARSRKRLLVSLVATGLCLVVLAGILFSLRPNDKSITKDVGGHKPAPAKRPEQPDIARAEPKPVDPWDAPAFKAWMKDVAAMGAEQQIEAVREKLVELNPDFDGTIHGHWWNRPPRIENGQVVEFGFSSQHVSDFSPLRVFSALKEFNCATNATPNLKPTDLSWMKGMRLKQLVIFSTNVSDLSPLRGMPLEELHIWNTPITDITPLKDMPLQYINFRNTRVTDFSPLKGMPLDAIAADIDPEQDNAKVEILRSIKTLVTINEKPAADFWKEVDEKLRAKNDGPAWEKPAFKAWMKEVAGMTAEDQLEAVKKKLVVLNPDFDGAIAGSWWNRPPRIENGKVVEFGVSSQHVSDFSPVRVFTELKEFNCATNGTPNPTPTDISWMKGLRLKKLVLFSTSVTDLSPLRGMPLEELHIWNTRVTDISPLKGMPLGQLYSSSCRVKDFSPLKGMPLFILTFYLDPERDIEKTDAVIRSLKGLVSINDKPPVDFWNEVDEQLRAKNGDPAWDTPAFKAWMKEVAGMTAEAQAEAVKKKLVELNPGFSGNVETTITEGEVWRVAFDARQVSDLSPLRALLHVYQIVAGGNGLGDPGRITDLSPLKGTSATSLWFDWNPISDLSPLKGLPLRQLCIPGNHIKDLTPLSGRTIEYMCLSNSDLSDLAPLKDVRMTTLDCHSTKIANLSPLENHSFDHLILDGTPVSDLTPLKSVSLNSLHIHDTKVSDLSPLKSKHLNELHIYNTEVTDLSSLQDMEIRHLSFSPAKITKGIDVVRKMKSLESIRVDGNGDGMPPEEFWKKYDAGEFRAP